MEGNTEMSDQHRGGLKCGKQSLKALWVPRLVLVIAVVALGVTAAAGRKQGRVRGQGNSPTDLRAPPTTSAAGIDVVSRMMEADKCELGLEVTCEASIVTSSDGKPSKTSSCSDFEWPPISKQEPCRYTPFRVGFLYNGGDCGQSDNTDVLDFECIDTEYGPPPTEDGAQSFIVVDDDPDSGGSGGRVYFEGNVPVGGVYYIEDKDGKPLEGGIRISIFKNGEDIGDPASLLQKVHFHDTFCSSPKEFASRFGALQLIGYENEQQGSVDLLVPGPSVVADVSIRLSGLDSGPSYTMTGWTTLTNFAGYIDLLDYFDKETLTIEPGDSISATIPFEVDLTERKKYTILVDYQAVPADDSEKTCTGTDLASFDAGHNATFAPTPAPAGDAAP